MPNSFCLTLFLPFLYHLLSFSSLWSWESCYHGYGWTMAPTLWKPHTHAHLHMLSVWSNGNHPSRGWVFIRSPSACSSLCPVTITWPPLPLTEMKNITGQKIHVHAQESLCYSHSQLVVKICKDKVLCSYYPLMITSSASLCHFGIPLSVQKCSGKDNKVSDSRLEHEQDWDWNICLLSLALHGSPIHYPSAPHPILHCTALLLDKYVLKRVCKEGRPQTNSLLQGYWDR